MENQSTQTTKKRCRKNERGAALVTVLMISFLLLVAVIGLLLEASMNTANVTDATAEQQAYYAAESGIQSAIDVLRGNSEYQKTSGDRIDFTKAVKRLSSNFDGDTNPEPRLSRWMNYNAPNCGSTGCISLAVTPTNPYNPQTGFAYQVTVADPDNNTNSLTYNTTGRIYTYGASLGNTPEKTFSGNGKSMTVKYNSVLTKTLDFTSGSASEAADLGSFTITGSDVIIPSTDTIRFEIVVKMTAPKVLNKIIRGTITSPNSTSVTLTFDTQLLDSAGSKLALDIPLNTKAITINTNSTTNLGGTMTPFEPVRLLVRSTGFGPRGAKKQLEAIVQKSFLDGLAAPATLTLVGSKDGFVFQPGTSAKVTYSGDDIASTINIPSIGTSNFDNLSSVLTELNKNNVKTEPLPLPTDVSEEMPEWLKDPYKLDAKIQEFRATAKSLPGRYFPNEQGQTQPVKGDFGDIGADPPKGITFVDGDVSLTGQGAGILICTGKLTLDGQVDFNGLIIVTGAGGIDRNGSGDGTLQGNTVVAPYNPADILNKNIVAQFLAPKYNLNGGGTSTIRYNSSSISNGLEAVSNFVKGVAEK